MLKRTILLTSIFVIAFSLLSCKPDYVYNHVKLWLACNQLVSELEFESNTGNLELLKVDYTSDITSWIDGRQEEINVTFSTLQGNHFLQITANAEKNELAFRFHYGSQLDHSIYIDGSGAIEKFSGLLGTIDILPVFDIDGTKYEDVYRYSYAEQIDNITVVYEFLYSKQSGFIRYSLGKEIWTRTSI